MRLFGLRLANLAVLVLACSAGRTRAAEVVYLESAGWYPTVSVYTVPTSYVLGSAVVAPTSYVLPTVYATAYVTESALVTPTTYLSPTYYETRFRRRGLFGRRLVATTRAYNSPVSTYYMPTTAYYPTTYYYPTTFYTPTTLDTGVVATGYTSTGSVDCCGGQTIAAVTPEVRMYSSEQSSGASSAAPRSGTRPRSAPLMSQPADEESTSSDVPELPPNEPAKPATGGSTARPADSPPTPPVPARTQSTLPQNTTGAAQGKTAVQGSNPSRVQPESATPRPASSGTTGGVEPPSAPAGGDDLQPAPRNEGASRTGTQERVAQKPVYSTTRVSRSEYRNVLFGRVRARDTNEPEEGVRVTISSRTNAYAERVALSDAFGRFAVKVPDGDWTVNVAMPSGKVYAVSQITVSNGLISDDIGRDIPSLVITR